VLLEPWTLHQLQSRPCLAPACCRSFASLPVLGLRRPFNERLPVRPFLARILSSITVKWSSKIYILIYELVVRSFTWRLSKLGFHQQKCISCRKSTWNNRAVVSAS
jgi:hypothetical protein